MTFNILLIQIVFFSCVFSLIRSPRLPKGWLVVSGLILALLMTTFVLVPEWAGWISGGIWALFVVVPLLGFAHVTQLCYQERYGQARRWAEGVRWLHPADGWVEYPGLLRGLELAQQGKLEQAKQVLQRYGTLTSSTGRVALAYLYRMGARWDELLTWIRDNGWEEKVLREPTLAVCYLRSLGETGDLNGLVQAVERFEHQFEKHNDGINLNQFRLFTFAFCGQTGPVRQLLQGPLAIYSSDLRRFWMATAEWAAGQDKLARDALLDLREHCDLATRNAIEWRLSHPCPPLEQLTVHSQQILAQLQQTVDQEARYSGRSTVAGKIPYVTYGVVGLNVLVFGLEVWLGGSENLETLYRLGALVPQAVLEGEWWRLVSAIFLHYGTVHLLANMVALLALGGFVERSLGAIKFLVAYLFSGIGSMAAIAALALLNHIPDQLGVGASGAIMGLLGVMAAILLKGWRREKAKIAAKRLRLIVLIVVIQSIFDVLTPQVSWIGHASGFVLGFGAGCLLFRLSPLPD
jgi:rhomboid protease GluP